MICLLLLLCGALHALPRAVVLTRNRMKSLLRLLVSIEQSQPTDARIDLHICCDASSSALVERETRDVARYVTQLQWQRGEYSYTIAKTPQRLTGQWINCAPVDERSVILEDDIEIAPYALKWLDDVYAAYADDATIAGFSLQRQTNCFHTRCASQQLDVSWNAREYKYALVGSWGYAPVARHWREFRAWYNERANTSYIPAVDDLTPTKWYRNFKAAGREHTMWTMWFIDYCNQRRLYTLYYNHPTQQTLGAHWAERGEHFDGSSTKPNFPLVTYDFMPIDRTTPPPELWWDARAITQPTTQAQTLAIVGAVRRLVQRGATPLLTFVSAGFRDMTRHFFCNLRAVAPELLDSLVIVAADAATYDELLELRAHTAQFTVLPLALSSRTKQSAATSTLLFGERDYFNMMLVRTRLIEAITTARLPLFLFECDAAVRENFVRSFVDAADAAQVDLVGFQDEPRDSALQPNAGFLYMTNRTAVSRFWQKIATRFERAFAQVALNDTKNMLTVLNDQLLMRELLNSKPAAATIHMMDPLRYRSGQTLDDPRQTDAIARSSVVLFNYVIGNAAKRRRAMKHGMWFYDEARETCRE